MRSAGKSAACPKSGFMSNKNKRHLFLGTHRYCCAFLASGQRISGIWSFEAPEGNSHQCIRKSVCAPFNSYVASRNPHPCGNFFSVFNVKLPRLSVCISCHSAFNRVLKFLSRNKRAVCFPRCTSVRITLRPNLAVLTHVCRSHVKKDIVSKYALSARLTVNGSPQRFCRYKQRRFGYRTHSG